MRRRELLQGLAGAATLNLVGLLNLSRLSAAPSPQEVSARRGLTPLKITDVKTILTAPHKFA